MVYLYPIIHTKQSIMKDTAYVIWKDFSNKDACIVIGAESGDEAWDLAESFLAEESDDDVTYTTGLPSGSGLAPNTDGTYSVRVKQYDNEL